MLTALAKFGKTLNGAGSKAIGKAVTPIAPGSYSLGSRWGAVGIWATYHTGQDFVAPIGTPIRAAADGVVLSPIAGAWAGTHVIIAHSDGSTLYAHMLATTVTPGQTVHAGDVIGFVGLTGRTTGAHLHFEFYPKGSSLATPYSATDPLLWLASRG
ncbi:M23 family metallopeptidase [Raineyella fluvialis]|uniref:M23 family metallopeptidase n=1 Tax=Raineyella fluvialis TaxID=2662261 RepID=UPI00188EDA86|nr:M23 family metallopeptidase [Raineyella fluvialis]